MSSNQWWQTPPPSFFGEEGDATTSATLGGSSPTTQDSVQDTDTAFRTLGCIPHPNLTFDHQAHYDTLDEQTKNAIDFLSGSVNASQAAIDASQSWVSRVKAESEIYHEAPKGWNPSLATAKEFARYSKTLNTAEHFIWDAANNNDLYMEWIGENGPLGEIIHPTYTRFTSNMDGELQEMMDMLERQGYEHSKYKSDICDLSQTYEKNVTRMETERAGRAGSGGTVTNNPRGANGATILGETDEQLKLPRDDFNTLAFRAMMVHSFDKADRVVARRVR